ncbi:MAG: hypothetical protein Q9224_005343, partial [Gallowayella concinna]
PFTTSTSNFMGNQISAATRKKSGGPLDKELAPVRSESENLSQQETLASRPTFRNRFSRLKPAIPKQMATPSLASSPSLGSSGSVTLHKQSTDTDGASSPKHENFEITLPAPSMKTDIQYLSFSLDAVSPSEASTITQALSTTSTPTFIIHITQAAIFQSPTVSSVNDLASASAIPSPVPTARQRSGTKVTANPFRLLSDASKDGVFAERPPFRTVHELWARG